MNNKITEILIKEHENILKLIDLLQYLEKTCQENPSEFEKIMLESINFCKTYADQIHHQKEENLLFKILSELNPMLQYGVVGEMIEHHEIFREMLSNTQNYLSEKKYIQAFKEFKKYLEILEDHIIIENNELFPMADDLLSDDMQEKIYFEAKDYENEIKTTKQSMEEKLNWLLNRLQIN